MPDNPTTDLTRRPHTGLRTPDTALAVTSLKELNTHDGVAFTATLRRDGKPVGTIENGGHGGMTTFHSDYLPSDPKALTDQDLTAYAQQCRTDAGNEVSVEHLLDELVNEFDWQRRIRRAAKAGTTKLRLMGYILGAEDKPVGEPYASQGGTWNAPPERVDLAHVTTVMANKTGPHAWWQLWTGERWTDVTPRPSHVPANLYR